MSEKIGGKKGEVFNKGVLSEFRKTENGFKVVTHLDHLPEPYYNKAHIENYFDKNGNYTGTIFELKEKS